MQSGIKLLLPLRFSERGIEARAKRACRAGKYNLTMTQTNDTKLLYKRELAKGRKREEEEEGERKWAGVQIGAGRSFLGDDCALRFFFFFFQFVSVFFLFVFIQELSGSDLLIF